MSSTKELTEPDQNVLCASCGAVDEIKFPIGGMSVTLGNSFECNGVRCCSIECREDYYKLHDKKLFTQPDETHLGECPLCFLPLPIDKNKSVFRTCCSEIICKGCVVANIMKNINDKVKALKCPFCREPANDAENRKHLIEQAHLHQWVHSWKLLFFCSQLLEKGTGQTHQWLLISW